MKNERKTKEQLKTELIEERRHVAELDSVFAALTAPVLVCGTDGIPLQANSAAVSAFGFDPVAVGPEILIQKLSLRHPDGRAVAVEELPSTRAVRGERVVNQPFFFANAHGDDFAVLASASPLVTQGKVSGAVTIWHDITEHERLHEQVRQLNKELVDSRLRMMREAEEARRRASEREMIIESIAEGVFVCNTEGRIIEVNEAGLKLIGLTRKEEALVPLVQYLSLLHLRHSVGRAMTIEELPLSRALRGEIVRNYEVIARSLSTQQDIYLLMSAAPVRDREERIVGAVAVIDDITALREIDKLKDEFISVAAHELKTPIAIMKSYAEVLLRTAPEITPAHRNLLSAIDRGADRIDMIVKDLLNISRFRLGFLELTIESIDLPELIDEAIEAIAPTTAEHRLRILRMEPVVVRGDPLRLEEVLSNLLDNAIKYSPQGGDIEVEIAVRDHEAVVAIKDHGIGIPKNKQAHIFERFYRAHTGTAYDYGGMGVGLFISKEIISRHGGKMWFESEEGKGSIFYFSLPLA